MILKLEGNTQATISQKGDEFKMVVISGAVSFNDNHSKTAQELSAGSFYSVDDRTSIQLNTISQVLLYIRSDNLFSVQ